MPIWKTSEYSGTSHVTRDFSCVVIRKGHRNPTRPTHEEAFPEDGLPVEKQAPGTPRESQPAVPQPGARPSSRATRGSIPSQKQCRLPVPGIELDPSRVQGAESREGEDRYQGGAQAPGTANGHQEVFRRQMSAMSGLNTRSYTQHYFGVANGTLGIMSRKKVLSATGHNRLGGHPPGAQLPQRASTSYSTSRPAPAEVWGGHPQSSPGQWDEPTSKLPPSGVNPAGSPMSGYRPDASPPPLAPGLVPQPSELDFLRSIDHGDWVPQEVFSARGLRRHTVLREKAARGVLHPTTTADSEPLARCLNHTLAEKEAGKRRGKARTGRKHHRRAIQSAPSASLFTSPSEFPSGPPGSAGGDGIYPDSRPLSPKLQIRSMARNNPMSSYQFSGFNTHIMKPTAIHPNPLNAGGFSGWKTIPASSAPGSRPSTQQASRRPASPQSGHPRPNSPGRQPPPWSPLHSIMGADNPPNDNPHLGLEIDALSGGARR